jgi:FAD/FMN-containing dehydrogenase
MASHNRFPFLGLALFTSVVLGAPPTHSVAACTEIKIALPGRVHLPGQAAYTKENKDYYNIGLADLRPTCITMPQSVQEVSQIVKILNKHESVPFAIKSGGHDPNPGHSSVKDGVLIALRYINGTEYDAAKGVAYVKPGGHWSDVITPLARQGQTVVSGRLGKLN